MKKFLNNALGSWITTLGLGVPGIAEMWLEISKVLDDDPATKFGLGGFLLGAALFIGGLAARDGNKSSEDVKVKDGPALH